MKRWVLLQERQLRVLWNQRTRVLLGLRLLNLGLGVCDWWAAKVLEQHFQKAVCLAVPAGWSQDLVRHCPCTSRCCEEAA